MANIHNGYRSEVEARRVRLAEWREEFQQRNEEHLAHGRERTPWAEFVQEKKYYADLMRQGEAAFRQKNAMQVHTLNDITLDGIRVTRYVVTDSSGEMVTYVTGQGFKAIRKFGTKAGAERFIQKS